MTRGSFPTVKLLSPRMRIGETVPVSPFWLLTTAPLTRAFSMWEMSRTGCVMNTESAAMREIAWPSSTVRCAPVTVVTTCCKCTTLRLTTKSATTSLASLMVTARFCGTTPSRVRRKVCGPAGAARMRYRPSAPVMAPTRVPVTVIVTPGNGSPPAESVTAPRTTPVACARASEATERIAKHPQAVATRHRRRVRVVISASVDDDEVLPQRGEATIESSEAKKLRKSEY